MYESFVTFHPSLGYPEDDDFLRASWGIGHKIKPPTTWDAGGYVGIFLSSYKVLSLPHSAGNLQEFVMPWNCTSLNVTERWNWASNASPRLQEPADSMGVELSPQMDS